MVAWTTRVVIKVRDNGPYKVTGPVTIVDAEGDRFELPEGRSRCAAAGSRRPSRSATPPTAARASTRASARVRSLSRP
jgi:hypothetical protein